MTRSAITLKADEGILSILLLTNSQNSVKKNLENDYEKRSSKGYLLRILKDCASQGKDMSY